MVCDLYAELVRLFHESFEFVDGISRRVSGHGRKEVDGGVTPKIDSGNEGGKGY